MCLRYKLLDIDICLDHFLFESWWLSWLGLMTSSDSYFFILGKSINLSHFFSWYCFVFLIVMVIIVVQTSKADQVAQAVQKITNIWGIIYDMFASVFERETEADFSLFETSFLLGWVFYICKPIIILNHSRKILAKVFIIGIFDKSKVFSWTGYGENLELSIFELCCFICQIFSSRNTWKSPVSHIFSSFLESSFFLCQILYWAFINERHCEIFLDGFGVCARYLRVFAVKN